MNGEAFDYVLLALTLAVVPTACVLATSFTKISIVLALVKNALGIQQAPSALVTNALALVVTAFIMAPVLSRIADGLDSPMVPTQSKVEWYQQVIGGPLGGFMARHVDPEEQQRLLATAHRIWPEDMAESAHKDDLLVLLPAFAISEITAAFKIGFLVFLAFVAVDLIVANVLMAMGMATFSPTVVSIPLKVVLFVAADGWSRLIQSLILTYQT